VARRKNQLRRLQESLRLTAPIVVLAAGVLVPVVLSTSVGIVSLVLGQSDKDLILGILVISFAAAAIGSAIVVTVLLGKRARTARFQTDLLGNVSHELKTPLAAIRMYSQTLQSEEASGKPEVIRQCADTIARETEWLGAMIERLLVWRSAVRDRENLLLETTSVAAVLEETAMRFARMLPPDNVRFDHTIQTCLAVQHDQAGIGSVVINLLENAYKYTGAEKHISLAAQDLDNEVLITITDNGIGLASGDLERIFEPFYRVADKNAHRTAGAGLGLAIVAHMVAAHSGAITVDSTPGQGSVFKLLLPAARAEG
jgi:two-component system, OmpR family, phosphate regulon sensor histidine kinase PhoR